MIQAFSVSKFQVPHFDLEMEILKHSKISS
jgi:hypothetical protein